MVDKIVSMSVLIPYEHQVGGWHKGAQSCVLKDQRGLILKPLKLNANPTYNQKPLASKSTERNEIVKPCDEELIPVCRDELGFYEHLKTSTSPDDTSLKSLMPTYHGSRQVVMEDGQEFPHLVLEDLTAGLQLPCVADIKIGHSFYYPGKEHYLQKTKSAAQRELGFCLTGLRVFHPGTGHISTELRPDTCKKLSISQVLEGLETFCQQDLGYGSDLRQALVTQLLCIHEWFLKQRSYKIRCSSILMVYDASQLATGQQILQSSEAASVTPQLNSEAVLCELDPKVTVKMIDFAHVLYSCGERDENYIFGLENLIKFLTKQMNRETPND